MLCADAQTTDDRRQTNDVISFTERSKSPRLSARGSETPKFAALFLSLPRLYRTNLYATFTFPLTFLTIIIRLPALFTLDYAFT
ncbi:hypothetical protein WH47_06567 [Habropoda laboriosa]|uniref:Uncharacterized protein n=1 Tax=Habropoda laboriosa TaxID=597456 RepID=A0A0L7RDA1_9HYME|nr:hypothetical protein WH47_06567 [Habropoda laboriosa]